MTEETAKYKVDRDVEKEYPVSETVAKLRRLADCLETGKPFEIMIDGERIYVPVRAKFSIEHMNVKMARKKLSFNLGGLLRNKL
jgi:hypothetical protein